MKSSEAMIFAVMRETLVPKAFPSPGSGEKALETRLPNLGKYPEGVQMNFPHL